MGYLNPHTHNLDGPDADGALRSAVLVDWRVSVAAAKGALDTWLGADRPHIVCLCGSTRFGEAFRDANLRETVAGRIVLSIGCDLRSDNELWSDAGERDALKDRLDALHMRKIDLADEVLVLNVGGYIGQSTAREVRYAQAMGKVISYLEPISP